MLANDEFEFELEDPERYFFNDADNDFNLDDENDYFPLSDQPTASYHGVLFTAELLERILFHLDTKTLLLSQRVCHFWRNTIQGSQLLQRCLFFQSDYIWDTRFIPASDGSCIMTSFPIDPLTNLEPILPPLRNPLLHPALKNHTDCDSVLKGWTCALLLSQSKSYNLSWRKMFLTQPALTGVFLIYGNDHVEGTSFFSNEKGVRAGDVADEMEDLGVKLGSMTVRVKDFVGSENWRDLEGNWMIEALEGGGMRVPPTQGLEFGRPREREMEGGRVKKLSR